jgi:dGTPase
MDWADDIAYSVHDLEDFHRCGVIPWSSILDGEGAERLVKRGVAKWFGAPVDAAGRLRDALKRLKEDFLDLFKYLLTTPYEGRREQRLELRLLTSKLIGRYVKAAKLEPLGGEIRLKIGTEEAEEVRILKQIARDYIIDNPSLTAQQKGQRRIIANLFADLCKDSKDGPPDYLPRRLEYLWNYADGKSSRFAADCIASLTESEAISLHARLQGLSSGSVLDPIVR